MTSTNAPFWIGNLHDFAEKAPQFVALPLKELAEDCEYAQPRTALHSLCVAAEALVKTLAMAASADIASSSPVPEWLTKAADEHLRTPTLNQWWRFLSRIAEKGDTPLMPELPQIAGVLALELFAKVPDGEQPERHNLLDVRNRLAHGTGISVNLARELLGHWGGRLAIAVRAAACLEQIECWAHEPDGFHRLNGPNLDTAPQTPPALVGESLATGEIVLLREERLLMLSPLGLRAPLSRQERALSQFYVRQGQVGLIYGLFGSDNAMQTESSAALQQQFDDMFNLASLHRRHAERDFTERGYEPEFERDAQTFIGRAEAVDTLWRAVLDTPRGLVFVAGPAGIGKSALVARVTVDLMAEFVERGHRDASREAVLAYRFIDGDRGCAPLPFLRWLIERLGKLTDRPARFDPHHQADDLLNVALSHIEAAPFQKLVLVLDGLDELARREMSFVTRLVERLKTCERLTVLVSSRPEAGIPETMKELGAFLPWSDGLPPMNTAELREMLVTLLPEKAVRQLVSDDREDGGRVRNRFIDIMVERSGGLPLFIVLVAKAAREKDFTAQRFADPGWLPNRVTAFFDRLVENGELSDARYFGPQVGALLALSHEPLSSAEIASILDADVSADQRAMIARDFNLDAGAHVEAVVAQVLRNLGGLLRVIVGNDGVRRYRLLHDDLTTFIRTAPALAIVSSNMRLLLALQAVKPKGAAARYLFANGIVHLLESSDDSEVAVRRSGICLSSIEYQLDRLQHLARQGGDGGIREDWAKILAQGTSADPLHRDWRRFWATNGSLLIAGSGRDGAREFVEMTLDYAPNTTIGAAAARFLHGKE